MNTRKTGSESSARLVDIAQRGLRTPQSLNYDEIQSLCGSVLRQFEAPTIPIEPVKFPLPRITGIKPLLPNRRAALPDPAKPDPATTLLREMMKRRMGNSK